MASEVGVLDIPPENILMKERLHPGGSFSSTPSRGESCPTTRSSATSRAPCHADWLASNLIDIEALPAAPYLAAAQPRDGAAAPADVRLHA
jgi:glutamate synthase (ferredoxin)